MERAAKSSRFLFSISAAIPAGTSTPGRNIFPGCHDWYVKAPLFAIGGGGGACLRGGLKGRRAIPEGYEDDRRDELAAQINLLMRYSPTSVI